MRGLYLLVLGAITLCIALPNDSPESNHPTYTQETRNLYNETSRLPHEVKLVPRATTDAYKVVQAAIPTQLIPGDYYFFMNCETVEPGYRYSGGLEGGQYVVDKVGCSHVGVVFGHVSDSGDDFEGWYLHPKAKIRTSWTGGSRIFQSVDWEQSIVLWKPRELQKLMYGYGGPTTAEKANRIKVINRGM
ncbi:hypothetical protein CORC01_14491 [Colletotrichum orchidophilum]|uniref:Uncharacterized protein n=1 Tax=Colletotrichum orchidophilum TaxID=1209926 RepID=A0A1G4AM20_9PEZI|nr:uncharacterized protein CORC01_14491 [Colletotrichum orchidophilum]OHE90218.1 hypothetical protein CORC01_14491 [Colletotrichum orchidophilum]